MQELLETIADIQTQLKPVEATYKALQEQLDQAKYKLMVVMKEAGSARSTAVKGYYGVIATRRSYKVADPEKVVDWLNTNNFNVGNYLKFDTVLLKGLAETALKTQGEYITGLELQETPYVSIKTVKEPTNV